MSHGLLRGAFRVPDEVCAMRSYLRQRDELVRQRSRAVHHVQKALVQMNAQLDNVLSDVMGKTGQQIVRAIGPEAALTIAAEVGADLSRFPTARHFCSWLALAPGTCISGDKRLRKGQRRQSPTRVGQALRMAATAARRDKSAIGAAHRRRLARMDTAKAVKATAHQLARLIYAMLTKGEEYVARDIAAWEEQRRDRMVANLQRQARRFDLDLVPAQA